MKTLLPVLLLALLLAACQSPPAPSGGTPVLAGTGTTFAPTPSPQLPSSTAPTLPTSPAPTLYSPPSPALAWTATMEAARTELARRQGTATAQAAPLQTRNAAQTATELAAWTATPTLAPLSGGGTPDPDLFDVVTETVVSPDGAWVAEKIMAFPQPGSSAYNDVYLAYLAVSPSGGGPKRVIVDQWSLYALGFPEPEVLGWSPEGGALYFSDVVHPDGCPPPGGWRGNLRRVDLQTGQVELLVPGWSGPLELSPDADRVVSYDRQSAEVIVLDLPTGGERRFPFDPATGAEWGAAGFLWSPDGQTVVFTVVHGDFCFPAGSLILELDLASGAARTLLEQDQGALFARSFEPGGEIRLSDQEGNEWLMDPDSGALSGRPSPSATPAPTPAPAALSQLSPPPLLYVSGDRLAEQGPDGTRTDLVRLECEGPVLDALRAGETVYVLCSGGLLSLDLRQGRGSMLARFDPPAISGRFSFSERAGRLVYATGGESPCSSTGFESVLGVYNPAGGPPRVLTSEHGWLQPLGISADRLSLFAQPVGCDPEFARFLQFSVTDGVLQAELPTWDEDPLEFGEEHAALSPDGLHLAFSSSRFVSPNQPLQYRLSLYDLAVDPPDLLRFDLPLEDTHVGGGMLWSPDSRSLYFRLFPGAPGEAEPGEYDLWRFDAQLGFFSLVTGLVEPDKRLVSISPDGEWLLLGSEAPAALYVHLPTGVVTYFGLPPGEVDLIVRDES